MEATTYQIKFNFIVHIVTLPDGLGAHNSDIVVLNRHSKGLLVTVERHAKDLLALSGRGLPPCDEVVCVLARG